MSNLVERLRKHVQDRGGPSLENGVWQMMLDAADEIERLQVARNSTLEDAAVAAEICLSKIAASDIRCMKS